MVVPEKLLQVADLTVRFIDTKGIDRNAAREDIECHFDDPDTLVVLCSPFNNSPAAETRLLLERSKDAGVRTLDTNVALLVLPRPTEELAMKDDAIQLLELAQQAQAVIADKDTDALKALALIGGSTLCCR